MSVPIIELTTERLELRLPQAEDAALLLDFQLRNRAFFAPTMSRLPDTFYTLPFWEEHIPTAHKEFVEDRAVRFVLKPKEDPSLIIGTINFTQIFRGSFQACYVGYSIDEKYQGKGLMYEALRETIRYMFEERDIHRIMANYLPENTRSARLLERLGFIIEGKAKEYLFINGEWRDHILTSKTNHNWKTI